MTVYRFKPKGWGAFVAQYVLVLFALAIVWQITRSSLASSLGFVGAALILPRVLRDEGAPPRNWDRGLGWLPTLVMVVVILGVAALIYVVLDQVGAWIGWNPSPWVKAWLGVFLGVRLGIDSGRALNAKLRT